VQGQAAQGAIMGREMRIIQFQCIRVVLILTKFAQEVRKKQLAPSILLFTINFDGNILVQRMTADS